MMELEQQLSALGAEAPPPAPSPDLLALVQQSAGAKSRQPARQVVTFLMVGLAAVGASLLALGLRHDLSGLPIAYVAGVTAAWLAVFGLVTFLALAPLASSSLPRARAASLAAVAAGFSFVALGLVWTESVPGLSHSYEATAANVLRWAPYCLSVGTASSLVPLLLGALLLRRAVPVKAPWIGAAIGAAGGCLGGLLLHFHCNIAEPSHFGFVHGGVVLIAAGLGALILPRALRP